MDRTINNWHKPSKRLYDRRTSQRRRPGRRRYKNSAANDSAPKTPPALGSAGSPLTWRNGLSSRFCRPRESASCPWWWFRFRFRWFSGLIFEEIPKRAKERFRKRRTESDLRAPGGWSHRYLEKANPLGREALQKPHVNVPQLGPFYWPFAGSKRSIGPL